MSIGDFRCAKKTENAALDCQAIDAVLSHVLGIDRLRLLTEKNRIISSKDHEILSQLLGRLKAGEPLDYVIGSSWFMGRSFKVDQRVLIPRPETEELVSWVKKSLPSSSSRILDIGTGSGAIGISLALDMPNAHVVAWDISEQALEVASSNARALKANIQLKCRDLFEDLAAEELAQLYDVVVSNPPYLRSKDLSMLQSGLAHEPQIALDGGDDGLLYYRKLSDLARQILHPGKGLIFVEVGYDQAKEVQELFTSAGYRDVQIRQDMYGKERMVRATSPCISPE